MRAEELDNLTEKELQAKANERFSKAENVAPEIFEIIMPEEKTRLYLEAQFYLTALARKRDERIARRDFWMEVAVIALIGMEIFLSVIFGIVAIREGHDQAKLLAHMDTSAGATADAMKAAKTSLESLGSDQAKSLDRLKEMNEKLQASLTATGTMASATHKQLEILKQEQADRIAQQAKKPKLTLYIGVVPASTSFNVNFPVREQTDTTVTLDLNLRNEGDATANKIEFRAVIFAKDVSLQASARYERTGEQAESQFHTYLIHLDLLRPKVQVPMIVTFSYPKGQPPFQVLFNVDADEIESGTPLGGLTLTPRKPTS